MHGILLVEGREFKKNVCVCAYGQPNECYECTLMILIVKHTCEIRSQLSLNLFVWYVFSGEVFTCALLHQQQEM